MNSVLNKQALILKFSFVTSSAVQLKFLVWKWHSLNSIVLEKPHDFFSSIRNVRSLLHSSKNWWKVSMRRKARSFKLHMTYGMLIIPLQVCSIFYLATNMNGTLRVFFYHLFSVFYLSPFFAWHFLVTFKRLTKTFQFLKMMNFTVAIQDHISISF